MTFNELQTTFRTQPGMLIRFYLHSYTRADGHVPIYTNIRWGQDDDATDDLSRLHIRTGQKKPRRIAGAFPTASQISVQWGRRPRRRGPYPYLGRCRRGYHR